MLYKYAARMHIPVYACMPHVQRMHVHIITLKATKDIAEGQELFIRYGGAEWFKCKNIKCADVDYANTMWAPHLHALPRRLDVAQITSADGRHSYEVLEAVPSETVVEISLCVEVSLIAVDQFPFLWDFVLTGAMEYEFIGCLSPADFCLLTRTHRLYVLQIKAKEKKENELNGFCIFFVSSVTLSQFPNP